MRVSPSLATISTAWELLFISINIYSYPFMDKYWQFLGITTDTDQSVHEICETAKMAKESAIEALIFTWKIECNSRIGAYYAYTAGDNDRHCCFFY